MGTPSEVMCCGLGCLDLELLGCDCPRTRENVTRFEKTSDAAGGCAPQTALALSELGVPSTLVTAVGFDSLGERIKTLVENALINVRLARVTAATAMAVLPVFNDGTRGCFVNPGVNSVVTPSMLFDQGVLSDIGGLRVFHFGYPHLMPHFQSSALRQFFWQIREEAKQCIITLDVNGVERSEKELPVIQESLEFVGVVHANLEESCIISGIYPVESVGRLNASQIRLLAEWFTEKGAGVACITCGKNGVFAATGLGFAQRARLSPKLRQEQFIYRPAYQVSEGTVVNSSGAGDAFMAGVIAELAEQGGQRGLRRICDAGLASALYKIDSTLTKIRPIELRKVLNLAAVRPVIEPDSNFDASSYTDLPLRSAER